tara:strand:- start:26 stop:535 length:510 start_codon:yes stop_codon:yes gene_type:complete
MLALERYLNSFGKYVIKQSRTTLSRKKKNVSKELYNSLEFKVVKTTEGFSVQFFMADYGTFIDKGVSGTKKINEYTTFDGRRVESPYKYKGKRPPMKVFDKWIIRRGIAPRDAEGRFVTRKSLQYLIANKIYTQGIQGISFFQRPLQLGLKDFVDQVGKAIKEDIINTI